MFRKLLYCCLMLTLSTALRVPQDYGPLQLDWNIHYKGMPDNQSNYFALTALVFNYTYTSKINGKNLSLRFSFTADVNKEHSWVKLNKIRGKAAKAALLRHEQGHVNINYLLMRETERKLRNRRYNVSTYKKEIENTAARVYSYYNEMQIQYDAETKHGTEDAPQAKWEAFINQSLLELEE